MKKLILKALSIGCVLSLVFTSSALALEDYGGYGGNNAEITDTLDDEANTMKYVETKLITSSDFVSAKYGSVSCLSEYILPGVECTLVASPKDENYTFECWKDSDGELLSTDKTLKYTFETGEKITAEFKTTALWDIDFDDGLYTPNIAYVGTMSLEADGDNKYMAYHAASAWGLSRITYNSNTDLYSSTTYKPNTTYALSFKYHIVNAGNVPSDILGIAPHMSLYSGNTPAVRLGTNETATSGWADYMVYFKTDEQVGAGYSTVADGLFQICAGSGFEIYIDNLKLYEIEVSYPAYENTETIGNYKTVNGCLIAPKGMDIAALRMVFKNAENAQVKALDSLVHNNQIVGTGMKLTADGGYSKDISVLGDYNGDGSTTVTDVLGCINSILGGNTENTQKVAIDMDENGTQSVTDVVLMRNCIISGDQSQYDSSVLYKSEYKEYAVRSYLNYVNINGRFDESILGITFDYAGMSMEFSAYCEGTVKVKLSNISSGLYFTSFVDGERHINRVTPTTDGYVVLAENLSKGYHTFEVARQGDVNLFASIDGIDLKGTVVPVDANNRLSIEFIGDSITSGCGAVYNQPGTNVDSVNENSDATQTYAFLTAHNLGANYKVFSKGGDALSDVLADKECIAPLYVYKNPWKSQSDDAKYDFGEGSDVVVINLGTNDAWSGQVSDAQFKAAMTNFIATVKAKNPNAKIVWCYGMMFTGDKCYSNTINSTVAELGGADAGYYACQLPYDWGSDYTYSDSTGTHTVQTVSEDPHFVNHPVVEGHLAAADVLTSFIADTVIPTISR